jgi:hypothetical protein
MNKWKILAWVFILITLGALKETHRILTSSAPDVAQSRSGLAIISALFTILFAYLAIRFWKKASEFKY